MMTELWFSVFEVISWLYLDAEGGDVASQEADCFVKVEEVGFVGWVVTDYF